MTSKTNTPYGKRLGVSYIEEVARNDPEQVHAKIAKSADPKDGFFDVTFASYNRAINALAWHLHKEIGPSDKFQTLTFASDPLDFRYLILIHAAIKIGWVAFLPSPRNSMEAHLSLLEEANCNVWLADGENPHPLAEEVTKHRPMKIVTIPSLNSLLFGTEDITNYAFTKTFEEARHDPMVILHTSGSTGIPKCIVCAHTLYTSIDAYQNTGNTNLAFNKFKGVQWYSEFPLFHAGGVLWNAQALYYQNPMVYAPIGQMSAARASAFHRALTKPCASILPPSSWKDIANDKQYLEDLENLDYAVSASGPMIPEVAANLAKHTHFVELFGITEASTLPTEVLDPEDWEYFRFDPHFGAKFDQVTEELYEMIYYRDDALADYQHVFETFPDLDKWSTKDLWSKHPTKPDLWKYNSRRDDIIVFSNGEKLNPVSFEMALSGQPQVSGAVVFGTGQFEAGVLVEVNDSLAEDEARNQIWPFVRAFNEQTVAHGRISKDMILISKPDKPLPRAGKKSIQKKAALKLYEEEIKQMYQAQEGDDASAQNSGNMDIATKIQEWLLDASGNEVPDVDFDLFEAGIGMDSLMVTRLARELNRVTGRKDIKPAFVYNNSTISKLASQLGGGSADKKQPEMSREQRMAATLKKFGHDFPLNGRAAQSEKSVTVAITGTTGSLGSFLLHQAIQRSDVGKIYCLNRRSDAEEVQKKNQSRSGLSEDFSKLTFLQIDMSKPRFGLSNSAYKELLNNVNLIIHNAWRVDWNLSIDSFESHIYGVRQFTDFCSNSTQGAAIVLLSTVGTVQLATPSDYKDTAKTKFDGYDVSLIPETTAPSWSTPMVMGYTESKLVSERLLEQAAEESGINATVCRVGQIAGPVQHGLKGKWSPQEWFPSLNEASLHLGAYPSDLGGMNVMDWIPVDYLAQIIIEVSIDAKSNPIPAVNHYHLVNPSYARYPDLLPAILKYHESRVSRPLKIVPLEEWATMLQNACEDTSEENSMTKMHAAQLIPHYKSLAEGNTWSPSSKTGPVMLDSRLACEHSETLKGMEPVKSEWMELWLEQWDFKV